MARSRSALAAAAALAVSALAACRLAGSFVARAAEAKAKKAKEAATAYKESAADKRLFEQVYVAYAEEYLKGPLYWHEDKVQGLVPDYPGEPMRVNTKLTSNVVGNLKTFSSNELAFFSLLFFGIGLYGHFMFNWGDPQILQAKQTG